MDRVRRCGAIWPVALLSACGAGDPDPSPPAVRFVQAPVILDSPDNAVPLAKSLQVETNVPTRLRIDVSDGDSHHFSLELDDTAERRVHPILGLKPGRLYRLDVTAIADTGLQSSRGRQLEIRTPPLPETFPPITVLTSEPQHMEPTFTMFPVVARDTLEPDFEGPPIWYLVIVDQTGDVVWYTTGRFGAVKKLTNGNLLALKSSGVLVEMSFLGEISRSWHPAQSVEGPPGGIAVDAQRFHHDATPVGEMASILLPSYERRTVDDFPTNESDRSERATVTVLDGPILEIDPADGAVLDAWRFLDILKPTRIGYDGAAGLPQFADWAHTNAVIHDPRDDSIIASLRSQDAVVKVSRATGELIWILGPHANWEGFERFLLSPIGSPFVWQYHQHAPEITPLGTLLLFDNGNYKASPFTGDPVLPASANWSRAVEYAIDEEAMTVRQVWEWGLPQSGEQLYAPFVGDADFLSSTGNVLISFAGICNAGGVPIESVSACETSVRIIEVARSENDRIVFDLKIEDPTHAGRGWSSYRSERIGSLY